MTKSNVPNLTPEQRAEALAKAAQARHDRAQLRDDIKSGKVTIAQILEMDNDIAKRMKVSALIESVPGFGVAKTAKLMEELAISPSRRMEELGISESRRVQGLGVRQRAQLIERIGDR